MTFEAYLERELAPSPATAQAYGRIGRRIEKHRKGPAAWLLMAIANTNAAGTIEQYLAAAGWYWKFLRETEGEQAAGPQPSLPRRLRSVQVLRGSGIPAEHLAEFVEAVQHPPEPIRTMFLLMLNAGLRVSEVCDLTHDDVLEVNEAGEPTVLRIRGKGRGGRAAGGGKIRHVPLGPAARAVLGAFLAGLTPGKRQPGEDAPLGDDGLLFVHRVGAAGSDGTITTSGYTPEALRAHLRAVRRRLGPWAKKVTPHTLRHTFAEQFLAVHGYEGLVALQSLLGHTDLNTTKDYSKESLVQLGGLVEKLVIGGKIP